MQRTKEFLETYICKAGETIRQIAENEWEIQKWTARTFKTLGNVFAVSNYDSAPSEAILTLNLKPKAKRQKLTIPEKIKTEAIHKGWLIQEIRFEKDGRTPQATYYRMGPGLFAYEAMKDKEEAQADASIKQKLEAEIRASVSILPTKFHAQLQRFAEETTDAEAWGKERVRKFSHFLIAFLQLRQRQTRIDFKEIGATYYQRIGGSKVFDHYKDLFITRLEKWLGAPIQELGIISSGSIVPIYFTGNLKGHTSHYSIGTVHATTDLALMTEDFQTDAQILWLVENRAVLTRMATEIDFLAETKSLVIGVDGQIRGAHRKLIEELSQSETISQVMIWTDYDKAGKIIAGDLVAIVEQVPYRIIGNENNLFTAYEPYTKWLETIQDAEQEMTLGGRAQWQKWISPSFQSSKVTKTNLK